MPLYEYTCKSCSAFNEILCEMEERDTQRCENCNGELNLMLSVFAKTPGLWGDSTRYYDRGLGTWVNNTKHKDQIMKERGLVQLSDEQIDDNLHAVITEHKEHQTQMSVYDDVLAKTGDSALAIDKAFGLEHD